MQQVADVSRFVEREHSGVAMHACCLVTGMMANMTTVVAPHGNVGRASNSFSVFQHGTKPYSCDLNVVPSWLKMSATRPLSATT